MKYMTLDQRGRVQAEYVWMDAVGGTRSKTKVRLHFVFQPLMCYLWAIFVCTIDDLSARDAATHATIHVT